MGFLFFLILIIVIANVVSNDKNKHSNTAWQNHPHLTPTYNYSSKNKLSSTPKFHSKTDTVELFGYKITNAMFYTCDSKTDMPFIINTRLIPTFNNEPTPGLNYWPNYNQISKSQQGYYIKWLADGKPYISELGYAYIYYYGLEYRALIEKKDLKEVLFEVINLVNTFKQLRYGYDLITYLTFYIKEFSDDEISKLLKFFQNEKEHYIYNSTFNAILYKLIPNDKQHIKFSAYDFYSNNDEYQTSLSDRKYELLSYYMDKMMTQLSESEIYTIKPQKYNYYMAMGHYRNTIEPIPYNAILPSKELKQIRKQAKNIIKNNIKQTVKKFDNSSEPLTEIEKLAYLPQKLRNDIKIEYFNFDFEEKAIVTIGEIASKLDFLIQDKTTLRQSLLIADSCEALGYEIEPNANIDKKPYKKDSMVAIYKTNYPKQASYTDYNTASLFLDLGFIIALEDKELLPIEINYIDNYIQNEFNLSDSEKSRLKMREELIIQNKEISTNDTLKKLISSLDINGKETIAKYIISVAMADGIVKASELKILQKIFKQLGFEEEYLNSMLSELIDNNDEVVTIEKGTQINKKGSKIPIDIKNEEKTELKLDIEKLKQIKVNTSEIHNVLQEIFTDEEAEIIKSEPQETTSNNEKDLTEVESDIQNIANVLISKESWTRNELLNVIQNKGKMLSSMIDEINEWSEEEFGDFLVEEDDDIYIVNKDVINLIQNKG